MIMYQIWKQKEACRQSPWYFRVYFVPFSFTCPQPEEFHFRRLPRCVSAYSYHDRKHDRAQSDAGFSADSPQEFLVSSCHYVLVKRLQNCGRTVLQLPTATHLHSADHHREGHLLTPSTDHHVSQRQELQQQVRYKLKTDLADMLTARTLE